MRVTYRARTVKEYWNSRWTNVEVDNAMSNEKAYPLKYSIQSLTHGSIHKSDINILEAGCGLGRIIKYFKNLGYKIKGIDFSETAINRLLNVDPYLDVKVGDICNLDESDNTFTHVFAFGLYHNLNELDMHRALIETKRVLKSGGILCASFRADNIQNLILDRYLSNNLNSSYRGSNELCKQKKYFHKINLSKGDIKNILTQTGFNIEKLYHVNNMPILFKFKYFRHHSQKTFNESLGREYGYKLNMLGEILHKALIIFFGKQFCNLYLVICKVD